MSAAQKKPQPAFCLNDADYRLSVENAVMHAVIRMDENGLITAWNRGAERMTGYAREEVLGCSISIIFSAEDIADQAHIAEMETALKTGNAPDERWHVRKDMSLFWGSGMTTSVYDDANRFIGYLKLARDETDAKLVHERLSYLTHHDMLTGLPNRRLFYDELHAAVAQAKTARTHLDVMFIDLDRFKAINDTLGHHMGDLFLKEVAMRLRGIVRKNDIVARLGGDEFGVICRAGHAKRDILPLAEKLVHGLSQPYAIDDKEVHSGASIGITSYPADTEDAGQLLKNADLAMYAAKSAGRSTYRRYTTELDHDARRRDSIENWLRHALASDALALHYQPQYSLDGRTLHGIEALLRWKDCPLPDVTSDEIIKIADQTGLIIPIGEWALRSACLQARAWVDQGMRDFRVAVNISSRQLQDPGFPKLIDCILRETGVTPRHLEFEITEFTLMENNRSNVRILQSLKKIGIHLSVDDFGTGFSSMSSLKSFPIDALKIDRTVTSGLPQSRHDAAIASAIIGLAHSLNLEVVAECVESREQADCLAALGCDFGQGYLFARPAPAAELMH